MDKGANPFAALFLPAAQTNTLNVEVSRNGEDDKNTQSHAEETENVHVPSTPDTSLKNESSIKTIVEEKLEIDKLLERIFLVTLDKDAHLDASRPSRCVYLGDLDDISLKNTWLDIDEIDQIVFGRLMMEQPGNHVVSTRISQEKATELREASEAGESEILRYLSMSYQRLKEIAKQTKMDRFTCQLRKCEDVIIMNAGTCLQQPLLYPNQEFHQQFVDIYKENEHLTMGGAGDYMVEFFEKVSVRIDNNKEDGSLYDALKPVLTLIHKHLEEGSKFGINNTAAFQNMGLIYFFSRKDCMAEVFMRFNAPVYWDVAQAYENTLLGSLLSVSCLPKVDSATSDLFSNPSRMTQTDLDLVEASLWRSLDAVSERVHHLLLSIIKVSAELKHQVLHWLGRCLQANKGRSRIHVNQMYCSDGFSLNLCSVLLRFCQPFSKARSAKLLKIQPSYLTAVAKTNEEAQKMNVHMTNLSKETCLIASDDVPKLPQPATFNFITECFYMAQYAFDQGFYTLYTKLKNLNKRVHEIQRLFSETQGLDNVDPRIKEIMETEMSRYFCIKAALTDPKLLEMSMTFHIASATWLTQRAFTESLDEFVPVTFPLPARIPKCLAFIPESFVDNLSEFILFLHRYKDSVFASKTTGLDDLLTFILVFMGSPERLRNPHRRAGLAEVLRALMPNSSDNSPFSNGVMATYEREHLFKDHPLIENLAETLLHVFVVIEMTGQNVEFEMKFQYRQPMYAILDYIWKIDVHKDALMRLAEDAEKNIEAMNAPLFLRFINLLINDATYLLDEALQHMSEIKVKQQEKESGAWEQLSQEDRAAANRNFQQITRLATGYNVIANSTIHTLTFITNDIRSIFTHDIMMDRVAGMLNYFLLHLVGPKQKNFAVKDKNEFQFKPQQIVSDITQIYLNLGEDDRFCAAVCRDGRSYSPDLFPKAMSVLQKIGRQSHIIEEFLALEEKLQSFGDKQQAEEDLTANAPEEFLDPIMGILMKEPVLLPTSKKIVDKSIIARHILSDQTDPFNRQPLTMDMVIPDTELKDRIEAWIKENKKGS